MKSSAAGVGAMALAACADDAQCISEPEWDARRDHFDIELRRLVLAAREHALKLIE
ncbi:MAG: hypothetical protein R3D57_05540 [Hyphomicrobiaceae bacterium]